MKSSFGIQPLSLIDHAFVWQFDDLESAKEAAAKLSQEQDVKVIVFYILGTVHPSTEWEPLK